VHELKSATNSDVFGIASALKRAVPDDKITHPLNFLTYCINSSGAPQHRQRFYISHRRSIRRYPNSPTTFGSLVFKVVSGGSDKV